MRKRNACVVISRPADYRRIYWLLRNLSISDEMQLQIAATDAVDQIRNGGFAVDAEVPLDALDASRSGAGALVGLSEAFQRLMPDVVVVVGSGVEALAAATAATLGRIPIAHIGGGEISRDAADDVTRHAITKLSHLHFVSARAFSDRVIQMGESPDRVFVFGAPNLDHLAHGPLPTRAQISERLQLSADQLFLVAYRPTEPWTPGALDELLAALDGFPDAAIAMAEVSGNAEAQSINARLSRYAEANPRRAVLGNFDEDFFLGLLKEAVVVIGNSSSGMIEAPAAGTPTVNIGTRQYGRLRSASIFDCNEDRSSIQVAIQQALHPSMAQLLATQSPAYGRPGDCSLQIFRRLRLHDLAGLFEKRFQDAGGLATLGPGGQI